MATPPSFPQFSNLPFELRAKIWSFTLPGARTISITCTKGDYTVGTNRCFYAIKFHSSTAPPVALSICQESRDEALRRYTLSLGTQHNEAAIPICFDIDSIRLADRDCRHIAEQELGQIRNLIVDVSDHVYFGHYNMEAIVKFTALEKLDLVIAEIYEADWVTRRTEHVLTADFVEAKMKSPHWNLPAVSVVERRFGDVPYALDIVIPDPEDDGGDGDRVDVQDVIIV
jgi:hypothetical protein